MIILQFTRCPVLGKLLIFKFQALVSPAVKWDWASQVAHLAKNPPAKQGMQFQSLGQEDPLEKEMATRSSILAWRISWTKKPGGLQSMGLQKSWTRLKDETEGTAAGKWD